MAARVSASTTGKLLKAEAMRRMVLDLPKIRTVVSSSNDDHYRLILLSVTNEDELTPAANEFLNSERALLVRHNLTLDYKYWTADDVMQAVLPEHLLAESPTGFALTGHIAHLNFNDEYLPYKHIIGQVIMDKNPAVRTVVHKLNNIHHQFRFFEMELIAGDADFVVEHHESNCRFTFDFTKVYWNSRLHAEHERLVARFTPTEGVIADVFAGVGPFAVPAAKKGCAVLANDLNPESVRWMEKNMVDNKVSESLRVFCEDGRDFIRSAAGRIVEEPFGPYSEKPSRRQIREERRQRNQAVPLKQTPTAAPRNWISHFVMNLPDSAIEFLDAYRGIFRTERDLSGVYRTMPMIHCHCFTRFLDADEAEADIRKRVEESLGGALEEEVSLHHVRSVAPNKDMYCISFRLPRSVACQ